MFAEALASYDRACAAGADLALERRALALARLGRALDAVRSLDAFLAAHPLDTLPEADRARIESNRRSLERQVVTLAVASQPEATVLVNGREIGQTPILHHRLAAGGEIELTLRAPGHLDRVQQVTLEAGVAQRIVVQLSPIPATAEPVVEPVEVEPVAQEQAIEPVEDSPSAESPTRARPDTAPIATRSEAERTPSQAMDRTPWVVVAGVVAAAGLGAGIGGVVLMSDRRSAMEGACFGLVPDVIPGCDAIRSEYDLGTGLAIGGFALAAIAGTAAVLIAVIPSGDEDPGSRTSLSCGLGLSGLACQGTF
ncbi:MAG: PEGA domain-containing protein [Sandaracinaceae bacterium]|nr:PEGA domain-containing protein [Sandaracinaceae bacterium]